MRRINKIEIFFENTEVLELDINDIGFFRVSNIKTNISSNYRFINMYKCCDFFAIEIKKEGNKYYTSLGDSKELIFDRLLAYNDIVGITIEYKDKEEIIKEEIEVPYTGEMDEINESQKTYLSKNGNLYIVIDGEKNLDIEDVFNMNLINQPKYKILTKRS